MLSRSRLARTLNLKGLKKFLPLSLTDEGILPLSLCRNESEWIISLLFASVGGKHFFSWALGVRCHCPERRPGPIIIAGAAYVCNSSSSSMKSMYVWSKVAPWQLFKCSRSWILGHKVRLADMMPAWLHKIPQWRPAPSQNDDTQRRRRRPSNPRA